MKPGTSFGSGRIYIWRNTLPLLRERLLTGGGPDTFSRRMTAVFTRIDENGKTIRRTIDCAHNEYINYLLNIGIIGLTTYLAFTLGALVRGFKAAKRNPLSLVFASAIVAYMAQAVVNIALPIATPLFIVCISLWETVSRQRDVASKPRNQRV